MKKFIKQFQTTQASLLGDACREGEGLEPVHPTTTTVPGSTVSFAQISATSVSNVSSDSIRFVAFIGSGVTL